MPTSALPGTSCFWPGPWPWTSAEGLSTRRYSAGSWKLSPPSKSTSSRFSARLSRISVGQGPLMDRGSRLAGRLLVVAQGPRLVGQHDRDAVADGVGQARLEADQLPGR